MPRLFNCYGSGPSFSSFVSYPVLLPCCASRPCPPLPVCAPFAFALMQVKEFILEQPGVRSYRMKEEDYYPKGKEPPPSKKKKGKLLPPGHPGHHRMPKRKKARKEL